MLGPGFLLDPVLPLNCTIYIQCVSFIEWTVREHIPEDNVRNTKLCLSLPLQDKPNKCTNKGGLHSRRHDSGRLFMRLESTDWFCRLILNTIEYFKVINGRIDAIGGHRTYREYLVSTPFAPFERNLHVKGWQYATPKFH